MRDRDLVNLVHADDSSDEESSLSVSNYALGEHFDDKKKMNWSKFNFLLGVRCLYQHNVSDAYYPKKTELGPSIWPAEKLKTWVSEAVVSIVENMLYHSVYKEESDVVFELFKTQHTDVINAAIEKILENPRALARQLRNSRKLVGMLEENLAPLRAKLSEFIVGITESDVAAAGAQPLSFENISDVAEFRGIIMQQALQFLRDEGLMRVNGKVALKAERLRNTARLEKVNLNLWQVECFKVAKQWDNANTNLQEKINNHSSEIINAWLRVAFAELVRAGRVNATDDPELFLIPADFDFSQGPLAPLFSAKPENFTHLFAKSAVLRETLSAKLAEDFSVLSAEIFAGLYQEQKVKMQRAVPRHQDFSPQGAVSWLAHIRLAIRIKRRLQRSEKECSDGGERVHGSHRSALWQLSQEAQITENQTISCLGCQTDMLPDLDSYVGISKNLKTILSSFNQVHRDFKLTDKNLAGMIISLLKKNKFPKLKKEERCFDLVGSEDFSAVALKKFIAALTCLLFVIEVQRHPAALVMHILMLDLIKEGKMTFAQAFEGEMPMAMEGAVAAARDIQADYREESFHPYGYPGAPKANPEFATKECALVEKWIGIFAASATTNHEKMKAVCERVQGFCAG